MKILLTGGCGFVGTLLTEKLLKDQHQVVVVDSQWFGNNLSEQKGLTNLKIDIRDINLIPMEGVDAIIHLANIANDPAVELDPTLSWEVNVLATQMLAEKAIKFGVKQFIYASSGSVYGVKDELDVTEDLDLVPISVYNKTKMVAERVLLSYKDRITVHCIRPATVCGFSPRLRLDVSVNLLTFQALKNGVMTVFGGDQVRPNIHIEDLVEVYVHFLENKNIAYGCYNAGFENLSILDIAKKISTKLDAKINFSSSNDPRSYRQNSDKLLATGFIPKFNVDNAIDDLIAKYQVGSLIETENCYTVKTMMKIFGVKN